MTTGTIKYFNPAKGFGFISSDAAGGKDVFFHVSKVKYPDAESSLVEGARVSYVVALNTNNGKTEAQQVELIDAAGPTADDVFGGVNRVLHVPTS